jgi:hypothetical protein
MEWWPILKSDKGDRIEWSSRSGENLRAKRADGDWIYYDGCCSANYALQIGEALLKVKQKNFKSPEDIRKYIYGNYDVEEGSIL